MTEIANQFDLNIPPILRSELIANDDREIKIGRVLRRERSQYHLITSCGEKTLRVQSDELYVGDWVQFHGEKVRRLPPYNQIARRVESLYQVMACNIDYLWIVTSVLDFNLNRLMRGIEFALSRDILPQIIINKMDLLHNDQVLQKIERKFQGQTFFDHLNQCERELSALYGQAIPFLTMSLNPSDCSSLERDPLLTTQLQSHFPAQSTLMLLGSSGVGKSTLCNFLCRREVQKVGGTNAQQDKGRHTTTQRNLIPLELGRFLLDNPGIRTLALSEKETFQAETQSDCYYTDCTHIQTPGCAILKNLEEEKINIKTYQNMLKLEKEKKYIARSQNKSMKLQEKAKWKRVSRSKKRSINK